MCKTLVNSEGAVVLVGKAGSRVKTDGLRHFLAV